MPADGGTGALPIRGNLKRGTSVTFRFCPNGTTSPATSTIKGRGIASITRTATGTYLMTLQQRHGSLRSLSGQVLKATADTYGPPLVQGGAVVEGSTSATTLYLYTYECSGTSTAYTLADITAAATTFVVGTATFEQLIG